MQGELVFRLWRVQIFQHVTSSSHTVQTLQLGFDSLPQACMAAFPFNKGTVSDSIQRHVVEKINSSDFVFELPPLSDAAWSSICNNSAERDRLEFVGDALMSGAVSEELTGSESKVHPVSTRSDFFDLLSPIHLHKTNNLRTREVL